MKRCDLGLKEFTGLGLKVNDQDQDSLLRFSVLGFRAQVQGL